MESRKVKEGRMEGKTVKEGGKEVKKSEGRKEGK